ncbi:hypothetical protein GN958_ATG16307 [Phytophthora infestans]|nr:hypothetical protein GN958_ATG16307 [Phytophthora infestans]
MKNYIVRYLTYMEVELTVVPYDYNLPDSELPYEASVGPSTKRASSLKFGIYLGNQNRALVAGVITDKLKYGYCVFLLGAAPPGGMWCPHEHGLPLRPALGKCQQRSTYVHIHGHDRPAFRSGGLSIDQAGELDYSSQAIVAVREEGVHVVHRHGAAISGSGRQLPLRAGTCRGNAGERHEGTALSVGIELYLNGDLERYNVRVMGTLFEAAELLSPMNYLYMTYGDLEDDIPTSEEAITVLGSGTHRNLSFVKIDWCVVSAVHSDAGFNDETKRNEEVELRSKLQ